MSRRGKVRSGKVRRRKSVGGRISGREWRK